MKMKIGAGKFKSQCLGLMEKIHRFGGEILVTKRGKPLVLVKPAGEEPPASIFGCMKGTIEVCGDLISPIDEVWDAER